jgi:hypothetical protein
MYGHSCPSTETLRAAIPDSNRIAARSGTTSTEG